MVLRRAFLKTAGLAAGSWLAVAYGQQTTKKKSSGVVKRKALKPKATGPSFPAPPTRADDQIGAALAGVIAAHRLPGMVGAVLRGTAVESIGATGLRKLGSDDAMQIGDVVHLGSDTKAMTATLLGMLVEDGAIAWSTTIGELFAARRSTIQPAFQRVTLLHLLTHRAGLPHDGPWWELRGRTATEKRRDLFQRVARVAPQSEPGSTFAYSNTGYAIAGYLAEHVTGSSWEDLMRERVFAPLGMTSTGFGPPGTRGKLDAPWGHEENGSPIQHDNAPAFGPAGTVHATLPDWAKFAALHLQAGRDKPQLLGEDTFRVLQTPPNGGDYACGWYVFDRAWAGGRALNHSGSNTYWYCTAWLAPRQDFGVLVATNKGGDAARDGCDAACVELIRLALSSRGRGRRT
jgi:CubicO group peptidase (beta-lactamase class C family)